MDACRCHGVCVLGGWGARKYSHATRLFSRYMIVSLASPPPLLHTTQHTAHTPPANTHYWFLDRRVLAEVSSSGPDAHPPPNLHGSPHHHLHSPHYIPLHTPHYTTNHTDSPYHTPRRRLRIPFCPCMPRAVDSRPPIRLIHLSSLPLSSTQCHTGPTQSQTMTTLDVSDLPVAPKDERFPSINQALNCWRVLRCGREWRGCRRGIWACFLDRCLSDAHPYPSHFPFPTGTSTTSGCCA